jgi:hypothetical protein
MASFLTCGNSVFNLGICAFSTLKCSQFQFYNQLHDNNVPGSRSHRTIQLFFLTLEPIFLNMPQNLSSRIVLTPLTSFLVVSSFFFLVFQNDPSLVLCSLLTFAISLTMVVSPKWHRLLRETVPNVLVLMTSKKTYPTAFAPPLTFIIIYIHE